MTLTFPALLEKLQLKSFDLCKLIETFVRHEPMLPRELKRHLFSIEEKMLESLAWERGSSLYPKLALACTNAYGDPLDYRLSNFMSLSSNQACHKIETQEAQSQLCGQPGGDCGGFHRGERCRPADRSPGVSREDRWRQHAPRVSSKPGKG